MAAGEASWRRAAMVERILAVESVSARVEAALRTVPRHLFFPDISAEVAYEDSSVVTKRAFDGSAVRTALRPSVAAVMVEQLRVEPGQRILQVGCDGYAAGLLAELVGSAGSVVMIDLDQDAVHRARTCLNAAGYTGVAVLVSNGYFGFPLRAPFDRILVTAKATDIPPAYIDQLVDGGRIVLPLQIRGLSRSVGFCRVGEILVSESIRPCTFPRMHGAGARRRATAILAAGVRLEATVAQDVDADALRDALLGPRHVLSTGVTLPPGGGLLASLELWLATVRTTYGRVYAEQIADQQTPLAPTVPGGVSAVWSDDSLASLTYPAADTVNGADLDVSVIAWGPDRFRLGDILAYDVQIWDAQRRGGPDPTIRVYPSTIAWESLPPGRLIDTPSAQIMITWD
ncbi:methyltransferase, FxLD system [Parafrankia sp. BMG5.11]|uniref:methyltransferase, FxLD system n=1 Tax=Parafrankia sp. BMG5.11 TaxID=222540 RepID=UPI001FB2D095|nr:methyltransferase, FxLD system [Parafrankia sp. BMG5.11]